MLAVASRRPVVCVTVVGGHDRLPRGSAFVRAGPVRVVFPEPIPNDGGEVSEGAERALAERVAETFERVKKEHAL